MNNIKTFLQYIKESSDELNNGLEDKIYPLSVDDIEDIFIELIDGGAIVDISFIDDEKLRRSNDIGIDIDVHLDKYTGEPFDIYDRLRVIIRKLKGRFKEIYCNTISMKVVEDELNNNIARMSSDYNSYNFIVYYSLELSDDELVKYYNFETDYIDLTIDDLFERFLNDNLLSYMIGDDYMELFSFDYRYEFDNIFYYLNDDITDAIKNILTNNIDKIELEEEYAIDHISNLNSEFIYNYIYNEDDEFSFIGEIVNIYVDYVNMCAYNTLRSEYIDFITSKLDDNNISYKYLVDDINNISDLDKPIIRLIFSDEWLENGAIDGDLDSTLTEIIYYNNIHNLHPNIELYADISGEYKDNFNNDVKDILKDIPYSNLSK